MRRGLLQDYANTVCQILTGWRLLVSPGDLDLLLERGTGRLDVDLLAGTAGIGGEPVDFGMAEEIRDWLRTRAEADGLGWESLTRAELAVTFDCRERRGRLLRPDVRRLEFACTSLLSTADSAAHARHSTAEVAVRRRRGPWVVT